MLASYLISLRYVRWFLYNKYFITFNIKSRPVPCNVINYREPLSKDMSRTCSGIFQKIAAPEQTPKHAFQW